MDKGRVVVFCCENSAVKALEALDGLLPEEVKVVKVPCAGRVEVQDVLDALEEGAVRVGVLACPLDNCLYLRGNKRAAKRISYIRGVLRDAGVPEEKVRIEFLSSVDPHKAERFLKELIEE